MELDAFLHSTERDEPPEGISAALLALWWDKKNNWDMAHQIAQKINSADGAWIHAYLHRKEGDEFNAGYWYSRAKKPKCTSSLDQEWTDIVERFLNS